MNYDKYDLIWLFESEPLDSEIDYEIYSSKSFLDFELTLSIAIYDDSCTVGLSFRGKSVFEGKFENVTDIKKHEEYLVIFENNMPKVRIDFNDVFSINLLTKDDIELYSEILAN